MEAFLVVAAQISLIVSASLSLLSGLYAAWLWYGSSQVSIDPGSIAPGDGDRLEPVVTEIRLLNVDARSQAMDMATIKAFADAGRLNARAAIWTAVSTLLAAFATFLGAVS
jgi:hypothetical protein